MRLLFTLSLVLMLGAVDLVQAQNLMPLPPHNSVFPGNVRGYWFTAPIHFTIVGVRVPTDAGTGNQNIAVMRFTAAPPAFPTTTNMFTLEALFQDVPGTTTQAVNIQVHSGDVIGIFGQRGTANSYATAGAYNTTIGGNPVTLTRMGMQFQLATTSPQDVWQEATGSISRTEMYYTTCAAPTPQILAIGDVLCHGDATGSATGGAVGGVAPYTYAWSTGDSVAMVSNLPVGQHTFSVFDDTGCQADTIIDIGEPDTITATFNNIDNVCFGEALGESAVSVAGGIMPYSYSWTSGGSAQTEPGLLAGPLSVDITDANGCVVTYNTLITEPAEIVISIDSVQPVTCEGDSDGMIMTSTTGGVTPYSVLWDDPAAQVSQTALNVPEGNWEISITDGNGCQMSNSAMVGRVFDKPALDLGGNATADDTFYDLIAPAGFVSYSWNNGANSPQIRVFANGTYTLTVTDDNGCSNSDEVTVSGIWATGIETLADGAGVEVYPNPTRGAVTLELSNWSATNLEVTLMTVGGQTVMTKGFRNLPSEYQTPIDLSSFAKGLYFLRIASEKGTITKRIQLQ